MGGGGGGALRIHLGDAIRIGTRKPPLEEENRRGFDEFFEGGRWRRRVRPRICRSWMNFMGGAFGDVEVECCESLKREVTC